MGATARARLTSAPYTPPHQLPRCCEGRATTSASTCGRWALSPIFCACGGLPNCRAHIPLIAPLVRRLCGYPPFESADGDLAEMYHAIQRGVTFPPEEWGAISASGACVWERGRRQALSHPGQCTESASSSHPPAPRSLGVCIGAAVAGPGETALHKGGAAPRVAQGASAHPAASPVARADPACAAACQQLGHTGARVPLHVESRLRAFNASRRVQAMPPQR